MNALGYLVTRSFANGVLFRLRRLRQPRYLLGALLGGAYFYFYFGKIIGGERSPFGIPTAANAAFSVEVGAAILFLVTLVLSWILPASRAAIAFTEAEIAFLFPAPIRRRTLVIMRLLKSQFSLLMFSAFMTLLTGRFRLGSEAWLRVGGWWVILNTLNLHRIGASFALQRLRERGMADWKRRALFGAAILALAVGVEFTRRSLPPPPGLLAATRGGSAILVNYLTQVIQAGPLPYVLAPFKLIVRPNFAHDAETFFRAVLPALGIMALHFLWVVRADVSFEDASIDAAKKRAAFVAARGRGETRARQGPGTAQTPLFLLRPTGFAPVAFVWKSLLKAGGRRTFSRWTTFFLILAVGAKLLGQAGERSTALVVLAALIGIGAYLTLLIGFVLIGQHSAAQLRQGIAAMDLLKTYPIPGWQLALGELAGPVTLGTLMQWCSLGIGILLLRTSVPETVIVPPAVLYSVAGFALLLPVFNLAFAILPSACALLFPAWVRPQENTGPGIEGTGLRLMLGISQLLAIVAALIPVAFFGALAFFLAGKFTPLLEWRVVAAGSTALLLLAMEASLGITWLGSLYDKFDVSGE